MQANIEAQFEARAGFPNVIEAIDCTHTAIKAPSHDEFVSTENIFIPSMYRSYVMRKCFVGVAWFNAQFIHSVTELLKTDRLQAGTVCDGWLLGE